MGPRGFCATKLCVFELSLAELFVLRAKCEGGRWGTNTEDERRWACGTLCWHHEVSRLIFGSGVGRWFGCWPRMKVSMMRIRAPQHGQGWSGAFGSSGLALAALMASIGMSGTASSARMRAIFLARAGEETVVSDAVEARWQHVHEKTADELVGIERHELVSLGTLDPIILPLESDVLVIECDEATVGDGDAVSVAREVAQDFLGAPKWSFAVDDPLGVAQRCQISGEASGIGERNVLTKELELSGLIGTGKLLQEQSAEQTRENVHAEKEVRSARNPVLTI
jgi:hypothetical protein